MLHESSLRPYQQLIIDHIIQTPKCAIWAGMGLGKTVSTLTAIDRMKLAGLIDKPVLVVAPLRVAKEVWSTEAREWSHLSELTVISITGTETERRNALRETVDVYACNFENLVWLIQT